MSAKERYEAYKEWLRVLRGLLRKRIQKGIEQKIPPGVDPVRYKSFLQEREDFNTEYDTFNY